MRRGRPGRRCHPEDTLSGRPADPGRLTADLHRQLGASHTTGIDRSEAMIGAAAGRVEPSLSFRRGDIGRWPESDGGGTGGGVDLVVANASLQWIPGHRAVLGRWTASHRPGGQLAVQVPANADHPSHLVLAEVAGEFLDDPPADPVAANVLAPEDYAYVVEWVKGTTLNRFKEALGPDRWEPFVERYRQHLLAELGDRSPYLYLFKRVLMWGRLP